MENQTWDRWDPEAPFENRLTLPGLFAEAEVKRDGSLVMPTKLSTYERAVRMLAARPRAVAELRRLMLRKRLPVAEVDHAIERLIAIGYLDDTAFARQYARSKVLIAGCSRRRIEQELARRGVSRRTAENAVAYVFEDEAIDESTTLEKIIVKRLRAMPGVDELAKRRRLFGFLARRGYHPDDIEAALDRLNPREVSRPGRFRPARRPPKWG